MCYTLQNSLKPLRIQTLKYLPPTADVSIPSWQFIEWERKSSRVKICRQAQWLLRGKKAPKNTDTDIGTHLPSSSISFPLFWFVCFNSPVFSYMATWFDLRDGITFQEVNNFKPALYQTKNISEKSSLDNLFPSSRKLAYEVVCVYTTFSLKKTNRTSIRQKQPTNQSSDILLGKMVFTWRQ